MLLSVISQMNIIQVPECSFNQSLVDKGAYQSSPGSQEFPTPLIHLQSINVCPAGNGQVTAKLKIERINGSTYSDIIRVWMCPVSEWDGFLCNSGQVLFSYTPNTTETDLTYTSPVNSFTPGTQYVVTTVTFRNGAELSGYTLLYPRSGVVTIGGIATTITNTLAHPSQSSTIGPITIL
jgi:hypothetical protein